MVDFELIHNYLKADKGIVQNMSKNTTIKVKDFISNNTKYIIIFKYLIDERQHYPEHKYEIVIYKVN
jgi:hypothetical protein